jgi:hypothetical protein
MNPTLLAQLIVGAVVGFVVGAILDWITGENPDDSWRPSRRYTLYCDYQVYK